MGSVGHDAGRDNCSVFGVRSKRAEVQAAALAEGKSEDDAREIAHEAAEAHWNAWAEAMLAERKAMEADGRWDASKADWSARQGRFRSGWFFF